MRDCVVVRGGVSAPGAQGLTYSLGVTSATTGARSLCLTSAVLPPGARSACHLHRGIESAGLVVSGTVETWWGERLDRHAVLEPGDYAFIPADVPHLVANPGREPALVVVAHAAASDQEGIELLPHLDALVGGGPGSG